MPAVFALVAVILLALAGFNVGGPRFAPGWLGLAFAAIAMFWAPISTIGG